MIRGPDLSSVGSKNSSLQLDIYVVADVTGAVGSSVVFLPPDIYSTASTPPSVVTSSCSVDPKINVDAVER